MLCDVASHSILLSCASAWSGKHSSINSFSTAACPLHPTFGSGTMYVPPPKDLHWSKPDTGVVVNEDVCDVVTLVVAEVVAVSVALDVTVEVAVVVAELVGEEVPVDVPEIVRDDVAVVDAVVVPDVVGLVFLQSLKSP